MFTRDKPVPARTGERTAAPIGAAGHNISGPDHAGQKGPENKNLGHQNLDNNSLKFFAEITGFGLLFCLGLVMTSTTALDQIAYTACLTLAFGLVLLLLAVKSRATCRQQLERVTFQAAQAAGHKARSVRKRHVLSDD